MQTMVPHQNSLHKLVLLNNGKTLVAIEFRKVVTAGKLKLAMKNHNKLMSTVCPAFRARYLEPVSRIRTLPQIACVTKWGPNIFNAARWNTRAKRHVAMTEILISAVHCP